MTLLVGDSTLVFLFRPQSCLLMNDRRGGPESNWNSALDERELTILANTQLSPYGQNIRNTASRRGPDNPNRDNADETPLRLLQP